MAAQPITVQPELSAGATEQSQTRSLRLQGGRSVLNPVEEQEAAEMQQSRSGDQMF